MNKPTCILFIGLLLFGTISASSINLTENTLILDELDQSQTQHEGGGYLVGRYEPANRQAAQSFIPQKGILTRVELYLSRWEVVPASQPLYLTVRKNINGETLAETSINPGEYP